jgi:hypothetical protein
MMAALSLNQPQLTQNLLEHVVQLLLAHDGIGVGLAGPAESAPSHEQKINVFLKTFNQPLARTFPAWPARRHRIS